MGDAKEGRRMARICYPPNKNNPWVDFVNAGTDKHGHPYAVLRDPDGVLNYVDLVSNRIETKTFEYHEQKETKDAA